MYIFFEHVRLVRELYVYSIWVTSLALESYCVSGHSVTCLITRHNDTVEEIR